MLGQFLELSIIVMTPVEEITAFLFSSEVLALSDDFASGADGFDYVLLHCEVHEEFQPPFRVYLLQLREMGLYDAVHHFQDYLSNILHHFG